MCIICAVDQGKSLSNEEIINCWKRNSDGGGYAFVNAANKIELFKSMDLEEFGNHLREDLDKYKDDSPFLIHFRIATHGTKEIDNVHPFKVNRRTVFAHNGILGSAIKFIPTGSTISDTLAFNYEVLKKLPWNFLKNEGLYYLIKDFIGVSNKLAFLTESREITVFNSASGETDDGRWFSNTSYKTPISTPITTNHKYNYQGNYRSYVHGYDKDKELTKFYHENEHVRIICSPEAEEITEQIFVAFCELYYESEEDFVKEGGQLKSTQPKGVLEPIMKDDSNTVYFKYCVYCGGYILSKLYMWNADPSMCVYCWWKEGGFDDDTAIYKTVSMYAFEHKYGTSEWYDLKDILTNQKLLIELITQEEKEPLLLSESAFSRVYSEDDEEMRAINEYYATGIGV